MSKQNELFEKAFEMMLEEAAAKADEKLGENIEIPSDEIIFSKEHEEKMKKLFRLEKRKEDRKKNFKYAQRVACVFLAFVLVSGVTLFSVEAWRIKFLNFVLELNEPNTDFNFNDNGGTTYSDDNVILHYVPMGFEMVQDSSTKTKIILHYESGEKYFSFSTDNKNANISIDTEDATIENLKINGCDAIYSSNKNINILMWYDEETIYFVMGNILKDEIIKIAENAEILS